MGKDSHNIVHEVEEARASLDRDLHALETRLRQEVDWRTHVARHPWLVAAASLACCLFVVVLAGAVRRTH